MTAPAAQARYETNQDVARRTRARVVRLRAQLIARLGGTCSDCGTTDDLSFDHPYGRDWIMNKKSQLGRLLIIRQEIADGRVELRCMACNRGRGGSRRYARGRR